MMPNHPSKHFKAVTGTPIYASCFVAPEYCVLGGGGGSSKTGIKNKLMVAKLNPHTNQVDIAAEYSLPSGKDAPTALTYNPQKREIITAANTPDADLEIYHLASDHLQVAYQGQHHSASDRAPDSYCRTCVLSPDGDLCAMAWSSGLLSLLSYPTNGPPLFQFEFDDDDVFDVGFDETQRHLLACAAQTLCVWEVETALGANSKPLHVIRQPSFASGQISTFRGSRFGRQTTSTLFFTVSNTELAKGTSRKANKIRKSYLTQWDALTCTPRITVLLTSRPLTTFDVSPNGKLVAYGTADMAVGISDSQTLQQLLRVLHAHDFPSTTLSFDPSSKYLLSGSADGSIRIFKTTDLRVPMSWQHLGRLVLLILVLVLISKSLK